MLYSYVETPIGPLLVAGDRRRLQQVRFAPSHPDDGWERDAHAFDDVAGQLAEYFAGKRRTFDVDLDLSGTPFQLEVWSALQRIPYGEVRSYGEIARAIKRPKAVRAVGAANGANPIPIIVPCHRVIGSNGSLTGFGGGLDVKRRLLELETQGYTPRLF
ncbi:MAG TPA: methylated-DNA--[protein]-cysteine S-methyltransferase [Thermoanaerobaculia bacterium]|nr:methylated-DNA--[protein]-cysteine S-methyltransferase [Thermoanaerobaculia bacterium]